MSQKCDVTFLRKTNTTLVGMNIQRNVISKTWQASVSAAPCTGQTTSGTLCLIQGTHFKRYNDQPENAQEI